MAISTIKSNNAFSDSVTSNGVKTKAQIANELYALIDKSQLTGNSVLKEISSNAMSIYSCIGYSDSLVFFARTHSSVSGIYFDEWQISSSSKKYEASVGASSYTRTDESSVVMPSGYTYRVRY